VVALVLTSRFIPESRAARARRIDPVGQLLVIALLGSLTYGIIEGSHAGWTSPLIACCFAVSVLAVAGLATYEKRRTDPLIDTRFFRSVPFSGATVIAVSGFAALGGFLFLNTLYLQNDRGLSALDAGLYMLPMAAMTLVFGPLSGRLVAGRGPRLPLMLAGTAMTASGVILAALDAQSSNTLLFTSYVLFGIGFGLINAPITNTAVSGMPRSQAGVAAAVASTSRQTGQSLGVAVVGATLAAGLHTASWWIITGCGATVLLLGMLTTGRWARGTAERTAHLLTPEAEDDRVPVSTR
jgi:MFS family permease